jgi:hypothetical protein
MLFAAAWVLNLWIETGVSVLAVGRSLAIVVLGVSLVLLVVALVSRRPHVAGAFTIVAFGLLVSRDPMHAVAIVILAVTIPLAVWYWSRIRRGDFSWQRLTHGLNLFGALTLVLVLAGGIGRGTVPSIPSDLQQGRAAIDTSSDGVTTDGSGPDILVLLLDGYPRADWYEHTFGGDNAEFLGELEARGFSVARDSTSNYMFTQLTLASMLHMRPVRDIPELEPVLDGREYGHPRLRNLLNDNPVFDFVRERGYRIATFGPGYEHVALRRADVYLDGGQLNDFEYELLRSTTIERILLSLDPGFLAEQKRDRVLDGFDAFESLGQATTDAPLFAFVHLPVPHFPVVFAADGGAAALPPSGDIYGFDDDDETSESAYREQLEFVNARTLAALDAVLEGRPPDEQPIMIVMSDHGAERRPQVYASDGTPAHYANLFAYRTPGEDDVFPANHSPINTFPRLFNRYFGGELALWPDERYPWIASP